MSNVIEVNYIDYNNTVVLYADYLLLKFSFDNYLVSGSPY